MRTSYPFFREPEESAVAVIGEEAAGADLSGSYEKPYAVLTGERLYCKNELGNFIVKADDIRSAGKRFPGRKNAFLWAAVAVLILFIFSAVTAYWDFYYYYDSYGRVHRPAYDKALQYLEEHNVSYSDLERNPGGIDGNAIRQRVIEHYEKIFHVWHWALGILAAVALLVAALGKVRLSAALTALGGIAGAIHVMWGYGFRILDDCTPRFWGMHWYVVNSWIWVVPCVVLAVLAIWWERRNTVYRVSYSTGAFDFRPWDYPASELRCFTRAAGAVRRGRNGQ